jgi:hypothetical protein
VVYAIFIRIFLVGSKQQRKPNTAKSTEKIKKSTNKTLNTSNKKKTVDHTLKKKKYNNKNDLLKLPALQPIFENIDHFHLVNPNF